MNPIRYIDIEQNKAAMIRHNASPLTVQLWIVQRRTIRRLDNASFRIRYYTIEPTGLLIGGATPEAFVSGNGGAAVRFGAGGKLR